MNRLATWVSVGLAAAGLVAGLALGGVSGCCGCDEPEPVPTGLYEITEPYDYLELTGALIEIQRDRVEISFTDNNDFDWVVGYEIVDRH